MTLGDRQRTFTKKIAQLILWAYDQGYEITVGDFWAHDGHIEGSYHYQRLAADLNLFRNGEYLQTTEDHLPLGEKWEDMGGTWGGRFKRKDGNHYSWGEGA